MEFHFPPSLYLIFIFSTIFKRFKRFLWCALTVFASPLSLSLSLHVFFISLIPVTTIQRQSTARAHTHAHSMPSNQAISRQRLIFYSSKLQQLCFKIIFFNISYRFACHTRAFLCFLSLGANILNCMAICEDVSIETRMKCDQSFFSCHQKLTK